MINSVSELLNEIYEEIKLLNTGFGRDPMPVSTELYPHLAKKFSLAADKVPLVLQMLVNAKMLFAMPLVQKDPAKNVDELNGYAVTRGNILSALKKRYEENMEREYSNAYQKKIPCDRLLKEHSVNRAEHNGTPFGIALNAVLMIDHNMRLLEKNIMQFAERTMRDALENEVKNADPLSFYTEPAVKEKSEGVILSEPVKNDKQRSKPVQQSGATDEARLVAKSAAVDKSLKLYGVEMYTRLCFRDYQFRVMEKIIEDGQIKTAEDLLIIKRMLDAKRLTADTDPKINELAADINVLMKTINEALKKIS